MGANCFKRIIKKNWGKICFYWVQIIKFLGADVSGRGAFFLCLGAFVWEQIHIFWGQFKK